MSATHDPSVRVVPVGPLEVLQLQLVEKARIAALEALHSRPDKATSDQIRRIASTFTHAICAVAELVARDQAVTDAQIEEAAEETGRAAVLEVLGPIPSEALN